MSFALLAGCVTQAPIAVIAPEVIEATPSARGLTQWQAEGKAGVTFLGNSITATYSWRRNGNDYDASAAGPLNQGYTTLAGRNGRLILDNGWLGHHESDQPDILTQAITGVPLPVDLLNSWLIGWPQDPRITITTLSGEQGVRLFQEHGWQVRVLSEQVQNGYRIPQRLLLTQNGNRILLFIQRWRVNPSA
ncbi:MAG: lipoprotein insertase outer membrane protein LolB [Paraperlucidibaca sp.]